jgi:hypothetical protein
VPQDGDNDVGTWTDGLPAFAKLGFNGIRAGASGGGYPMSGGNVNITNPLLMNLTGSLLTGGGTFINNPNVLQRNDFMQMNASQRSTLERAARQRMMDNKDCQCKVPSAQCSRSISCMADEPLVGGMNSLTGLVGNETAAPGLTLRWQLYLQNQDLKPADLVPGATEWDSVIPAGRPSDPTSLEGRRLYYWTTRFIAYDAAMTYATGTNMSRKAFYEDIGVYANLNNWGGRYFFPGPFDNTTKIYFDWMEYGRVQGASLM